MWLVTNTKFSHFMQWSILLPSELKFCILGQQFTESRFIQYEVW